VTGQATSAAADDWDFDPGLRVPPTCWSTTPATRYKSKPPPLTPTTPPLRFACPTTPPNHPPPRPEGTGYLAARQDK
jgi:hypothetical protein